MKYRIIRGRDRIGGTITEIMSDSGGRIWVDFGAELPSELDGVAFKDLSDEKMIEMIKEDAPDAYMFQFEADGQSIIHTGDFRNHGRLGKNFLDELKSGIAGKSTDTLIIEGTMMSRQNDELMTEEQLQAEATSKLVENPYAFLICSSTNMESLASFYWATLFGGTVREYRDDKIYKPPFICNRYVKKQLDLYTKEVGKNDWRFRFDRSFIIKNNLNGVIDRRNGRTQKQRMIYSGFTMLVNPFEYYRDLMSQFKDLKPKPIVFYSMWDGYLRPKKPYTNHELIKLKEEWKDSWIPLHTSGHAGSAVISQVIEAVNPREIVPVHTENRDAFKKLDILNKVNASVKSILL